MRNKLFLIVVSVLALGTLFFFGARAYKASEAERLGFMAKDNFQTFVRDHSPRKGSTEARVFITEFLDPECESCREFHPHVKMLMNEFEGKIQLVVRYAPFHGNSIMAVKLLEAARKQGKYWEALEIFFQRQPEWGGHHHPRPELLWTYLPLIGLDVERIKADMEDPKIMEAIQQDIKDGQDLGVRGTPTFFVNGAPLEGFGPEALRGAITRALGN